jgi:hypothetical protein
MTKRIPRKFWFAVSSDIFEHEVVGAHVAAPRPADKSRHAWQPMTAWLWFIKEAARQDRERIIKGKVIPLRRGQLAVSLRYLAREANWGVKAVRVFLERLQTFKMIEVMAAPLGRSTETVPVTCFGQGTPKKGTTITVLSICNYDTYQSDPKRKGTQRAQQGHSRGTAGAQDSTVDTDDTSLTDHHLSNRILEDDDRLKRVKISTTIVQALTNHVGQERSDELRAEWLGSSYARNAKIPDKAFIGWLRKTYGIQISGAGNAAPDMAEILAMCGTDKYGRPDTTLPKSLRARSA